MKRSEANEETVYENRARGDHHVKKYNFRISLNDVV
jgi:hypothetical protein